MTVSELIEALKEFPPETAVMVTEEYMGPVFAESIYWNKDTRSNGKSVGRKSDVDTIVISPFWEQ